MYIPVPRRIGLLQKAEPSRHGGKCRQCAKSEAPGIKGIRLMRTPEARGLADFRNLPSYAATKALIAVNGTQFVLRKAA